MTRPTQCLPGEGGGALRDGPKPFPKFDNPKMEMAASQQFGAGREQRIYALSTYCQVVSLDIEDFPFEVSKADHPCDICGATDSYLDEVIMDDSGQRMFVCSVTDCCASLREAGHIGTQSAAFEQTAFRRLKVSANMSVAGLAVKTRVLTFTQARLRNCWGEWGRQVDSSQLPRRSSHPRNR